MTIYHSWVGIMGLNLITRIIIRVYLVTMTREYVLAMHKKTLKFQQDQRKKERISIRFDWVRALHELRVFKYATTLGDFSPLEMWFRYVICEKSPQVNHTVVRKNKRGKGIMGTKYKNLVRVLGDKVITCQFKSCWYIAGLGFLSLTNWPNPSARHDHYQALKHLQGVLVMASIMISNWLVSCDW